jgi:hypothetical protein
MLRRFAVAAAVLAVAVSLSASARPAPDLDGNWIVGYYPPNGTRINYCIVKIETKNGKPTASVVASLAKGLKVTDFKVSGQEVTIGLGTPSFVGTVGDDPDVVVGSMGNEQLMFRGKLIRTDKEEIDSPSTKEKVPEPMTKAMTLANRPTTLRIQAQQEKDAAKRKDLLAEVAEAQKEADEQLPGLYREVIADHPNDPAALDAAMSLLTAVTRYKVTPAEGRKFVRVIQKQSPQYGTRYVRYNMVRVGKSLATQKGFEPIAVDALKPIAEALTDKDPAATQVEILSAYKIALEGAGKADEAKAIDARLTKLETKLDEEYLASVPPFKPRAYAGRKEQGANRVAVMELFTGAQCPPCVAADVAFDALGKSYKPTDLVLLQYHLHIPGPDPMTNPDTLARAQYYRVNSTPSTFFNGKAKSPGGGPMAAAETKYDQYRGAIDPLLEDTTSVKMGGKATRAGDAVKISVQVSGLEDTDDLRLRVLVVEDVVKFVGGNQLRFHHHVVRAMPGGVEGVEITDKSFRHAVTADLAKVRKATVKYLDDYAENERPFPQAARPLDMKDLKVIALVQNDKTKEIVQAVQIEVEGKTDAGGDR